MQNELLEWYAKNHRDLAFRKDQDAYKIWISEIMAQQTRIEAMLPYFERFLILFPNLTALANADDEALHKAWQGLGYYSRCRNLKKCAIECMKRFHGELPKTKAELKTLPGIGEYTAGAIASIAYKEKVSAVDGNVIRVFSRLYDIQEDVTSIKTRRKIESLVDRSLVQPIDQYNQAIMELGALICIPKVPKCSACPIREFCQASDPASLPIKPEKKKRKKEKKVLYVWVHDGRVHLNKRKATGLLANMYEFDEKLPAHYESVVSLGEYTHIFSHVEWEMQANLVYTNKEDSGFYAMDEIENEIALPSAFKPFYERLKEVIFDEEKN